jgi:hypothetical protein
MASAPHARNVRFIIVFIVQKGISVRFFSAKIGFSFQFFLLFPDESKVQEAALKSYKSKKQILIAFLEKKT